MPFIVLDGPDATGTSTHARLLAEKLTSDGWNVLVTAEPTDGPVGKRIREILNGKEKVSAEQLQEYFTDDRIWHVQHVIQPALELRQLVICDRYWHSTIAYAAAQGLPTEQLFARNFALPQPDLVLFTLPPVATALQRLEKRSTKDLFERESFQRAVHEQYHALAKTYPNIIVVDTSGDKESIAQEIVDVVKQKL
jgi:dTMP kinase